MAMDTLEKTLNSNAPLPQGYVFVAKGNVYITRRCREKTRQAGRVLFIVQDPRTKLRIGLACPDHVFRDVQASETATAADRQRQVATKDKNYIANARVILLRLFPRIPPGAAEAVLKHGYLKGSGRVGRSSTMSDSKKMIMAVTAHARHKHTPYDALLREKGRGQARRFEARAQIRGQLLQVLRNWGMVGQLRSLEPDTDLDSGNDSSKDSSYDSDNILENSCVDIISIDSTPEQRRDKSWKEESPLVLGKSKSPGKAIKKTLASGIHAPGTFRHSPKPKGRSKAPDNRVQKPTITKKNVSRKRPNTKLRSLV